MTRLERIEFLVGCAIAPLFVALLVWGVLLIVNVSVEWATAAGAFTFSVFYAVSVGTMTCCRIAGDADRRVEE